MFAEKANQQAWVLENFTFAADITSLKEKCKFAFHDGMAVARYFDLPFTALSFFGEDHDVINNLAKGLVEHDNSFYMLLNDRQSEIAKAVFDIESIQPEWQMIYSPSANTKNLNNATPLSPEHFNSMKDLAIDAKLMAFEENPFQYGPAYGLWDNDILTSMACTHLSTPNAVEIGNIATRMSHRRKGLAHQVTEALAREHAEKGLCVFLMVFQNNHTAIKLYEKMGFQIIRSMNLCKCRIKQ